MTTTTTCPMCKGPLREDQSMPFCNTPTCTMYSLPIRQRAWESISSLRAQRDEAWDGVKRLQLERDEAVAALATMTQVAQKATLEFGTLAVEHAKQANERATGVPEADMMSGQCLCPPAGVQSADGWKDHRPDCPQATPAAPPVAEDADALLDALGNAYSVTDAGGSINWVVVNTARAAVRARMRSYPTNTELNVALIRTMEGFLFGSLNHCQAALEYLMGKK